MTVTRASFADKASNVVRGFVDGTKPLAFVAHNEHMLPARSALTRNTTTLVLTVADNGREVMRVFQVPYFPYFEPSRDASSLRSALSLVCRHRRERDRLCQHFWTP